MRIAIAVVVVLFFALLLSLFRARSQTSMVESRARAIAVASCPNNKLFCWRDLVMKVIAEKGLDDGFSLVEEIYTYRPEFRPQCGALEFKIADAVFEQFPDYMHFVYTPETTICNYGFYQEYPYKLLLSTDDVKKAKGFCDHIGDQLDTRVPSARAECYRGIGRALPFVDDTLPLDARRMADRAGTVCKSIAPDRESYQNCLSGSFNQLGRNTASGKEGLSAGIDPLAFCDKESPYIKGLCMANYKWAAVPPLSSGESLVEAFKKTASIYGATSTETMQIELQKIVWTWGYELAQSRTAEAHPQMREARECAQLPASLVNFCVWGIAVGIAKSGTPHLQDREVIAFCSAAHALVPSLGTQDCPPQQAVAYLKGFFAPADFKKICSRFMYLFGSSCDIPLGG